MPTSTSAGPRPAAGPTRRRIAGDRGRRRADSDDGLEVEPDAPTRAEILSSADAPLVVPEDEPTELPASARDPGPEPPTDVRLRPRWVLAALSICLVAVLAACLLEAVTTRADRADVKAGDAALAAATSSAATILSYDYRHLDADFAKAGALTTGSFRTDYQATTAKAVQQLATQTQAVVVAKVVAGGVVSSSTDQVTVLLFVNQTTTSNRLSSATTDLTRVQMTLTRSGSRWLVSALKAL